VERTVTAAFTVKWLWLGVDHYNPRFFGSAAGVASGLFPVGVAEGRCHSAKQSGGSIRRAGAVGLSDDPNLDGRRDAVRGADTSTSMDSGAVRLNVFSQQVFPIAGNVPFQYRSSTVAEVTARAVSSASARLVM